MHHLSGIFIQRGRGTPSQWNIYLEQGGTPPHRNIYPEGAGYTTLVEYLSTAVGVHHLSGIFIQSRWVHHLSGIFIQRGGVHHLSGIFIHMGGGTPPQWNIYPEGEVHHLNGILIHRGGGYTTSMEYFSQPPIFPNSPFFHPFCPFWGGCSPVLHGLPFFPTFNFHDGFFLWVAVLGKGGCQTFSCPFLTGGKEGRGRVPHFYQTFGECVLFYVLDTRCQIRLQTSDFIHIAGPH